MSYPVHDLSPSVTVTESLESDSGEVHGVLEQTHQTSVEVRLVKLYDWQDNHRSLCGLLADVEGGWLVSSVRPPQQEGPARTHGFSQWLQRWGEQLATAVTKRFAIRTS